jgi:DNA-directed RNA polymerase specialized sigma24 family protein
MHMLFSRKSQDAQEQAAEYATRADFQTIFTEDMAGLHLLAYLLTADPDKSERCFVAGLEDSLQGNQVFQQWARSWSKRAMIKNAIKAIRPVPGRPAASENDDETGGEWTRDPQKDALIAAVTQLAPFERFVFVMAVLEGYSLHECAVLLGESIQEVVAAKSRALQCLGPLSATPPTPRRAASWMSFLAPNELA